MIIPKYLNKGIQYISDYVYKLIYKVKYLKTKNQKVKKI